MHQPLGDAMEVDREPNGPMLERNCLQERDQNHQCTRFCTFKRLFGNLYFCETSRQTHVCDDNCANRIYYDSSTTICRLSKKLFPNDAAPGCCRKRSAGEENPEWSFGKRGRQ